MTDYMARALELAEMAKGTTGNNPAVGAVVVRDGRIVGEGFTQPPGQAHAEIVALRQAGEAAGGATVYVTLEPCCHHGRTPPCTDALLAAGVAEVHMAMLDPNPLVAGGGRRALEAAGVRTFVGERGAEARRSMEAWLTYIRTGRPMVTAKYAMSLDGKIATVTGDSRWITGVLARQAAHRLRAESGAVMVGVNTVIRDDPQLTARDEEGRPYPRQPLRVVVDSAGRVPLTSRIISGELPGRTLLAFGPRADPERCRELERRGNTVLILPEFEGRVSLEAVLRNLAGEWEVTSAMVEGGGSLLGSFFDQQLVDKVVAFIAPRLIGGAGAPGPIGGRGVLEMAGSVQLGDCTWRRIGDDLMVVGYVEKAREAWVGPTSLARPVSGYA